MRAAKQAIKLALTGAVLATTPGLLWADDGDDLQQTGIDLLNPANSLFAIYNEFSFRTFQGDMPGAEDQDREQWDITTSFPIELSNGKVLSMRATIPINFGEPTWATPKRDYAEWGIRQDADDLPAGYWLQGHGHMGDISYDIAYGGVSDTGWITMYGIAGVFPTGQDGSIERDQYLLGPEFAFGRYEDWGIWGAWIKHLVDVADVSSRKDIEWNTSETHIDVFFSHRFAGNWQFISTPTVVYDWEAAAGNEWQVPISAGIARTFSWWNLPVKLEMELDYFVVTPDFYGPDWMFRLNLIPVISDRSR